MDKMIYPSILEGIKTLKCALFYVFVSDFIDFTSCNYMYLATKTHHNFTGKAITQFFF